MELKYSSIAPLHPTLVTVRVCVPVFYFGWGWGASSLNTTCTSVRDAY